MKPKKGKSLDVQKFGGVDNLGKVELHGHEHEAASIETQSKTKLEDDQGFGDAAIVRCFTFGINLKAFQDANPTKQDLFNHHIRGIEVMLWRDGMRLMTDVAPQITLDMKAMQYRIFVGARPAKGYILKEIPQTLSQIVHG